MSTILTLDQLSAYDPGYRGGAEQRYCCPLPACAGKARTRAHRSLAVNTRTGAWHCHRCGASGLLKEYWTRDKQSRRQDLMALIRQPGSTRSPSSSSSPSTLQTQRKAVAPAVFPAPRTETPVEKAGWPALLESLQPFLPEGEDGVPIFDRPSPAAAYLQSRGLDPVFSFARGSRYAPDWLGKGPAAVFPLIDGTGETVALQGRYLRPADGVKCRTAKRWEEEKHNGLFVTAGVFNPKQTLLLITEAPIDLLSLLQCGFDGVATCGAGQALPEWFLPFCRDKRVMVAFDNDSDPEVSKKVWYAEEMLGWKIFGAGGVPSRFHPYGAMKDWNECLREMGSPEMKRYLVQELHPKPVVEA